MAKQTPMSECAANFGKNLCGLGIDCQAPGCRNEGKPFPDEVTVFVGRGDVKTEIVTKRHTRH
jgi:hypothetical protein